MSKLSEKLSTESVDKHTYEIITKRYRDPVVIATMLAKASRKTDYTKLDALGREIPDPRPLTVAVKLPTLGQQFANFTRLGELRQAEMFDDLGEDDWNDDFDDLPDEGLSQHELHEIRLNRPLKPYKPAQNKKATPIAGEAETAPTQQVEAEPAPAKSGD